MVRGLGCWPDPAGHVVRSLWAAAAFDRWVRNFRAGDGGRRHRARPDRAGGAALRWGHRRLGGHGDQPRGGARSGQRRTRRDPDVAAGPGDGRGADPGAECRRGVSGHRALAVHLLVSGPVRRVLCAARMAVPAGNPAREPAHPDRSGANAVALRIDFSRTGFPGPCDHGRRHDVLHVRLSRRIVAGVHSGVRFVAVGLRPDFRPVFLRADRGLADQRAAAAQIWPVHNAAGHIPDFAGRDVCSGAAEFQRRPQFMVDRRADFRGVELPGNFPTATPRRARCSGTRRMRVPPPP